MPAKEVAQKKRKPRKVQNGGPVDSVTWEEHGERARFAIGIGTGLFLKANAERIEKSTSEVAARNSYMSGMLDMLTVARNALGFWGAHQILLELERLNMNRIPAVVGPEGPHQRSAESPGSVAQAGNGGCVDGGPSIGDVCQKETKGTRRDPMFA
jgi:hypothetical protein